MDPSRSRRRSGSTPYTPLARRRAVTAPVSPVRGVPGFAAPEQLSMFFGSVLTPSAARCPGTRWAFRRVRQVWQLARQARLVPATVSRAGRIKEFYNGRRKEKMLGAATGRERHSLACRFAASARCARGPACATGGPEPPTLLGRAQSRESQPTKSCAPQAPYPVMYFLNALCIHGHDPYCAGPGM